MNANDWLELITQLFFILLSGITIIDFLRYRDTARRDIALMFCSLSMAIWVQFVTKLLGIAIPWLTSLAVIAFLAQPYLMLRLVQFFRPVPFAVRYVALLTMVVSWLTILFGHAPYSIILVLVVIANFVVIDGFAMFAFVRGAMTTSGVVRKRLRFVAAGSGLLASLLLIAGIFSAFPEALPLATSLIQIVAIAAALAFYLGFASPRWLRHAWQLTELRNYLLESATKQTPAQMGVSESLNRLCQAANRAVGGMAAAVIQWNEAPGLRSMSAVTDGSTFLRGLLINQPIIEKAWRERRAIVIYSSNKLDTGDYQLLKSVGADTLLIVPLKPNDELRGLLLVFLRYHSLFIDDDLRMLELLAQQSTILLENYRLLDELRDYSEHLEQKVEERTAALRHSEELYRTIARNFPNGSIVMFDRNLRYLVADGRGLAEVGFSREELEGKTIWDLFPQKYCDEVMEPLYRAVLNGTLKPFETPYGERIRFIQGVPVQDEHGETFAGVLISQDITERRRAEDEVRRLNAGLEERVLERTSQLEAANKELEAFSYSISHDLRAPLRAVNGFSQILLDEYRTQIPTQAVRYLDLVSTNARQMGELIDDLLAFSRLSRQPLKKQPVAITEMVRKIFEDIALEYQGRQVEFKVADLPGCEADPALLRQVLENLLSNAVKYTRKCEPAQIEVGWQDGEKPAYFVRDNGAGFDMRYANKLFGVFQRLHRAEDYEGTGVGLAIVQRIINRHGGAIWAEAQIDKGATFYFTLGKDGNDD